MNSQPLTILWAVRRSTVGLISVAFAFAAGACAGRAGEDDESQVVVFAASSLTEAFTDIGEVYERANPGTVVALTFAGSGELAAQLRQGAPADVFAAADTVAIEPLTGDGTLAGPATIVATNSMAIVTAAGNPLGIESPFDLDDDGVVVVVCADTVPCGRATSQMLHDAEVSLRPSSFEDSVKGVLSKVVLGEADAGVVFATDAIAAGDGVATVPIDAERNVITDVPMAVVASSSKREAAQSFIDFVASPAGQQILVEYGFGRA
jgi:molybdate transport system substrate-binding protein